MSRLYIRHIADEIKRSKVEAKALLLDPSFDRDALIHGIESLRKRIGQNNRPVTEKDMLCHLAIQLRNTKNEKEKQ